MFSNNMAFWLFFGIYIIIMFILAFISMRKTTDLKSFAVSNGDVGPIAVAITFAATFMSAATFVGMPGHAYQSGLSVLFFHSGQWFPCAISLIILTKVYRKFAGKLKSLSLPDWIGRRYDSDFLRIFTALVTLLMVVQIGSQLAGVGTVLENIAGVPYQWGVVIAVLIIMFYLCVGGTYAHIYTNIVQGAMVVAAGTIIFISGFFVFGNIFTEIPAMLAAEDSLLAAPTSSYNAAYGSFWAIFGIYITHIWWTLNPHQINKFQYLKSEKDIRKFIIFTCIFIFFGALTQASGLYTRALVGASLDNIDNAAVTYLSLVFPKAFAALLTVIILAAVMSTTDGIMVYLATVLGNELYMNGLVRSKEARGVKIDRAKEEKIALRICQFGVIVVGLIGLPIALKRPASISTLLWVGNGGVMGGVAGPIILGLFNKRTGKAAAIAGSICGFAGFMILYFGGIVTAVYLANALGGLISVGVTFVCTYIFKPMPKEKIDFLFGETGQASV